MNTTVHVLTIEHRHGTNVSAHRTHEGAEAELARYVAANWAVEHLEGEPSTDPEDYFEAIGWEESYDITSVPIED